MKNKAYPFILTLGRCGYTRAPGTVASFVIAPCIVAFRIALTQIPFFSGSYFFITILSTIYAYKIIKQHVTAQDPKEIVLDECIGVQWLFIVAPNSIIDVMIRLIVFRFFDITKIAVAPLERLRGAVGILADDIAAAIISEIIVLVFIPC